MLGRTRALSEMPPVVRFRRVSRDYFAALEIPVLRGRMFDAADEAGTTNAAVVR